MSSAKATTAEEQSDGIVVSFNANWLDSIRSGAMRAVIRKRVPKTVVPTWLYFHLNSPFSCICARARILGIEELSETDVVKLRGDLCLTREEIRNYFGGVSKIGCYRIGAVEMAKTFAEAEIINKAVVYNPPQSFFIMSHAGMNAINRLTGFKK